MRTGRRALVTIQEPVEGLGPLRLDLHPHPPGASSGRGSLTFQLLPLNPVADRPNPRLTLPLEALWLTSDALHLAVHGVRTTRVNAEKSSFRVEFPVPGYGKVLTEVHRHHPDALHAPNAGSFLVELESRHWEPADAHRSSLVFPLEALEPAAKAFRLAVKIEGDINLAWFLGEDL